MAPTNVSHADYPTEREIRQTVGEAKELLKLLNGEVYLTLQFLEDSVGKGFDDYPALQRSRNLLLQQARAQIERFVKEVPNLQDRSDYEDVVDRMFNFITYKTFYDRLKIFMLECFDQVRKDLLDYVLDETRGTRFLPRPLSSLKATITDQFKELSEGLKRSSGIAAKAEKATANVRPDIKRFFMVLLGVHRNIKSFYHKYRRKVEVTSLEAFLNRELVTRSYLNAKNRIPLNLTQGATSIQKKRSPLRSRVYKTPPRVSRLASTDTSRRASVTNKPKMNTSVRGPSANRSATGLSTSARSPPKPARSPPRATRSPPRPTRSPTKPAQSPVKPAKSPTKPARSPAKSAKSPAKSTRSPLKPARNPSRPVSSVSRPGLGASKQAPNASMIRASTSMSHPPPAKSPRTGAKKSPVKKSPVKKSPVKKTPLKKTPAIPRWR